MTRELLISILCQKANRAKSCRRKALKIDANIIQNNHIITRKKIKKHSNFMSRNVKDFETLVILMKTIYIVD